MRILHLSDLHLSAAQAEDQRRLIDAALADISRWRAQAPFDLVLFSGDLTFSGQQIEFELAEQLVLTPLEEAAGVGRERIVLVPGNHDVDLSQIDLLVEAGTAALLTSRGAVNDALDNPSRRAQMAGRLRNWNEFVTSYYVGIPLNVVDPLARAELLRIDGVNVGVLALNSAWRASGGADDRQRLLLGERQVRRGVDAIADADVRLIVMHHPLDWLMPFDEDIARDCLFSLPSIIFTGHLHEADPSVETGLRGVAYFSRGGCLYESIEYSNSFAVMDINLDLTRIKLHLRSWWGSPRNMFDDATNLANGGVFESDFPAHGRSLALRLPPSRVIAKLNEAVSDRTIITEQLPETRGQIEALVSPNFLSLPYREALVRARLSTEVGHTIFKAQAPIEVVDGRVTVVSGDDGSGVTMALYWLLLKRFDANEGRLPLLVKFDPRFKDTRFMRQVAETGRMMGYPIDDDDLPPLMIALDDVQARSVGYLDALARFIVDHPEHTYVLGCHEDVHEVLSNALAQRSVAAENVFLGPFQRSQLRRLIEGIAGGVEVDEIVRNVARITVTNELPRTPLIMTALATVIVKIGDLETVNESTLLDAYLALLLARQNFDVADQLGLNVVQRQHLLSEIAAYFVREDVHRVPRLAAERFVGDFFERIGWGTALSPGDVVNDLITRRVLSTDWEGVGFSHIAFENLFAARRMRTDVAFADLIFSDPTRYRRTLIHAMGLSTSNRELLERIRSVVAGRLTEVVREKLDETFQLISNRPGWSNEAESLDDLKQRLRNTSGDSPDTSEWDEELDDLDMRIESRRAAEDPATETPEVIRELAKALELASNALRSSDLVSDIPLKLAALKQAIHGWASFATLQAIQEDQDHTLTERVTRVYDELGIEDPALLDRLNRFADLFSVVISITVANAQLGTKHLEGTLERLLADSDFMSSPIFALFASSLYVESRLPHWSKVLRELHRRHGSHPIIREVVKAWAVYRYKQPNVKRVDLERLEAILADIYAQSVSVVGRAPESVKAVARGEIIRELQRDRAQALRQPIDLSTLDAFEGLAEVDDNDSDTRDERDAVETESATQE